MSNEKDGRKKNTLQNPRGKEVRSLLRERGNVAKNERGKGVKNEIWKGVKKEIEAVKGKKVRKENEARIKLEITESAVKIRTETMMGIGKWILCYNTDEILTCVYFNPPSAILHESALLNCSMSELIVRI